MTATIEDLLRRRTADDELAALLTTFAGRAFPVADWFTGGAGRTLAHAIAVELAAKAAFVPELVDGGYAHTARATWLDLLAEGIYGTYRAAATKTVQRLRVECDPGQGPQVVNAGFTVGGRSGNRYIYDGPSVPVEDGGSVAIDVVAEAPGARYDDQTGTIDQMVTPLPGLRVLNVGTSIGGLVQGAAKKNPANHGGGSITPTAPAPLLLVRQYNATVIASAQPGEAGAAGGSLEIRYVEAGAGWGHVVATLAPIPLSASIGDGITLTFSNGIGLGFARGDIHTWSTPGSAIIVNGVDQEPDEDLAKRLMGRWPSLSANVTKDKYVAWVRQASIDYALGISKIVANPSAAVAGQTDIVIATAIGEPSDETVATVQAYVDARDGDTDSAGVIKATNVAVTPTGVVAVRAAEAAAVKAAADLAWQNYLASLPIGGDTTGGTPGVVRLAELYQAVMAAGAVDAWSLGLNNVSANLVLGGSEVAAVGPNQKPSQSMLWQTVP